MLHFDDIVFGPISSRRLGVSLGVNVLPAQGKLCNFDCIYCECGWNRDGVSDGRFPVASEVAQALEEKLSELSRSGERVDSITFSGNGEPTLNPDFPEIVETTIKLRDRFYPSSKISVLSNATMLGHEPVYEALRKVDNPILKLDAPVNDLADLINRPQGVYRLEKVVESLMRFDGNFILQTMFLRSPYFDVEQGDFLEEWRNIVRKVMPREIMVYTIDRDTPDKSLGKYGVEEMTAFVRPLLEEGFNIQIRG